MEQYIRDDLEAMEKVTCDNITDSQSTCCRNTFAILILVPCMIDFCFFPDYNKDLKRGQMTMVALLAIAITITSLLKFYVSYASTQNKMGIVLIYLGLMLGVCQFPMRLIFMVKESAHPGLVAIAGPILLISLLSLLEICAAWRSATKKRKEEKSVGNGQVVPENRLVVIEQRLRRLEQVTGIREIPGAYQVPAAPTTVVAAPAYAVGEPVGQGYPVPQPYDAAYPNSKLAN